ncbi:hypothetical protein pb186bvf_003084 [Paramecium bursaria]
MEIFKIELFLMIYYRLCYILLKYWYQFSENDYQEFRKSTNFINI